MSSGMTPKTAFLFDTLNNDKPITQHCPFASYSIYGMLYDLNHFSAITTDDGQGKRVLAHQDEVFYHEINILMPDTVQVQMVG